MKGILRCGSVIAVKKFNEIILAGDHPSFENEASFLMDLKHQNIIQLLGYCAESKGVMIKQPTGKVIVAEAQTRMLCFEYMCNGGLDKHLSGTFQKHVRDIIYQLPLFSFSLVYISQSAEQ